MADEEDTFYLVRHGPIMLLEEGEDLRTPNVAGLNDDRCGLLSHAVEYVVRLNLGEFRRTGINLTSNRSMVSIGCLLIRFMNWLTSNLMR